MKKIVLSFAIAIVALTSACKKSKLNEIPEDLPRTDVPSEVQGKWMFGNFSMTEFWNQDPADYLGNALEFAIAFQFEPNGLYTQYFTSSSVVGGVTTYQQSITKGTVEIDPVNQTIVTHPYKARYKRTSDGRVLEERDLRDDEVSSVTYIYEPGVEPSGTNALYLTLGGTNDQLTFLKKQ
jgi:hypothetical protein